MFNSFIHPRFSNPRKNRLQPASARSHRRHFLLVVAGAIAVLTGSTGCQIGNLIGGMAAVEERTRMIDIPAQYTGLEEQRVAVLIDAPMDILYEHPNAVRTLTEYISLLIAGNCFEARVIPTRNVLAYLNQNVYWPMMDYGQLATELGVDRIVIVDLIEYRLFERGNSYYWDGQVIADINVFEAEGVDSTDFGFTSRVRSRYPTIDVVAKHQANEIQVESGLQKTFAKSAVWLFYDHQRLNADLIDESRRKD